MRLRELVNCHGCLRATREWSTVEVADDGRGVVRASLCAACRTDVLDAVRRSLRDLRGAAVSRW